MNHPPLPEIASRPWRFIGGALSTGAIPRVMGILNVTPDSFSDGGRLATEDSIRAAVVSMVAQGAEILDIGGESSRPGAEPVSERLELARVLPAIKIARECSPLPISIDTVKPTVARAAIQAGAAIINDIGGMADPAMRKVASESGAGVIAMHMRGQPRTMQNDPSYLDVVEDVKSFLRARIDELIQDGVRADRIMIDPGIGFGKTLEHNLTLLRRLDEFESLGHPILLGISRKSIVGHLTGKPLDQRLAGTLALQAFTMARVGHLVFRVHDVGPTVDLCKVFAALRG